MAMAGLAPHTNLFTGPKFKTGTRAFPPLGTGNGGLTGPNDHGTGQLGGWKKPGWSQPFKRLVDSHPGVLIFPDASMKEKGPKPSFPGAGSSVDPLMSGTGGFGLDPQYQRPSLSSLF